MKEKEIIYDISAELEQEFGPKGSASRKAAEDKAWEEYNAQILLDARKNAGLTQQESALMQNMTRLRTFNIFKAMAQIKNEAAYRAALKRVEQLEELVDDDNPTMDENALELDMLVDMVEEYEDIHYPIGKPSLVDTIKLRLYEMGITQTKLAELLGISPARVSDIMRGKCEPTLKVARELCQKLNISPSVVLGI